MNPSPNNKSRVKKNLKSYIWPINIQMRLVGVWTDEDSVFVSKYFWIYTIFVQVIMMGAFIIAEGITVVQNVNNLSVFTNTCYIFFECLLSNLKGLWLVKNWILIRNVLSFVEEEDFQPKNQRQVKQLDSFIGKFKLLYYTFLTGGMMMIVAYGGYPLLQTDKVLPFPMPFDCVSSTILYTSTFVYQVVVFSYLVHNQVAADALFVIIMVYIAAECDILADKIKHLYDFTADETEKRLSKDERNFREVVLEDMDGGLIECVKHHEKILRFADEARKIYNGVIFLQFSSSLPSICLTLFQLTLLSPYEPSFYATLSTICEFLLELGLYSWYGNEVIEKSCDICNALYNCDWMDCSLRFKKNMLTFMQNVQQRPIQILAIDFFLLCIETFKSILKTSYSTFTVLRTVQKK